LTNKIVLIVHGRIYGDVPGVDTGERGPETYPSGNRGEKPQPEARKKKTSQRKRKYLRGAGGPITFRREIMIVNRG